MLKVHKLKEYIRFSPVSAVLTVRHIKRIRCIMAIGNRRSLLRLGTAIHDQNARGRYLEVFVSSYILPKECQHKGVRTAVICMFA